MYAGFIVERSPVLDLYQKTSHPYTLGLLESLPKVTAKAKKRLVPIEGLPPDMLQEPTFCPFADRCRYRIERCWEENPPLIEVADDHFAACWRAEELYEGFRLEATAGELL